jgi:hypothetical protein
VGAAADVEVAFRAAEAARHVDRDAEEAAGEFEGADEA